MQSFIGAGIVVGGVETVRQEIVSYVHTYTQHKSELRETHTEHQCHRYITAFTDTLQAVHCVGTNKKMVPIHVGRWIKLEQLQEFLLCTVSHISQ